METSARGARTCFPTRFAPMKNDFRFALRMIATHRWFSAIIIVTLALGIGINTTVFTLVNAVLFKPVPVPGGERLVTVLHRHLTQANNRPSVSYPDFREYQAQNKSFAAMEALMTAQAILSDRDTPPERFQGARVSPGMFAMLGTPPILGAGFTTAHGERGAEPAVMLSHAVWQSRYGGARDVIGRAVQLNGQPATIVGVMPEGFKFPSNQELWWVLVPDAELEKRTTRALTLMGMRKPGVSVTEANADLDLIAQRLAQEFPDSNKDLGALVRTFHDTYNAGQIRVVFLTMLGAVGFVLLIACANVANLMLSRSVARAREISIRVAMGATRWQIVRQLLVESVVLSCLGGLAGLGLAWAGVRAFDVATQDVGKPYWIEFTMDLRALLYFAAVSVTTGIVFGLVPALRASRVDLNTTLKDGTPSGGSARGGKLTAALVVFQFALTMILLASAGMMVRAFFAAQTTNAFVRAESLITARVQLPEGKGDRYEDAVARRQFWDRLLPELTAIPGVTHAAVASNFPGFGGGDRQVEIEGQPIEDPKRPPTATMVTQSVGYLPANGVPLLLGRGFNETDGSAGNEATVVTKEFAEKYWPGESALGKRVRFINRSTPQPWMTVIGVSADVIHLQPRDQPLLLLYVPYQQEPWGWMGLVLRTNGDPTTLVSPLRRAVQKLDPDLPLFEVRTLTTALERQRWFLRVFGVLFAVFAAAALLMAAVGIYGVIAHSTERRTREIGIRMALGATAGRIARLVLSRGLRQLALGLGIGLGGAFGATHLMKKTGLVLQVSPYDPVVFGATIAVLLGIGLFACWLPARRAAALHPVTALRHE